jgi:hypothetical protein
VLRPRQQAKLARGGKDEEHAMSHKLNSAIAVIGIDIGKNSFHVVGHDNRGAITLREKWSRGQVERRLANLPPCLIGMEACVGAHHLSRQLRMLGHDARLMPARYVRPQAPSRAVVQANTPFRRGKVGSFALAPIVLSLEAAPPAPSRAASLCIGATPSPVRFPARHARAPRLHS